MQWCLRVWQPFRLSSVSASTWPETEEIHMWQKYVNQFNLNNLSVSIYRVTIWWQSGRWMSMVSKKKFLLENEVQCSWVNSGVRGRAARRKPPLSAVPLQFARGLLDNRKHYWKNVPWLDETKEELFGLNEKCYVWRQENSAFQHRNQLTHLWNMVGAVAQFGPSLLALDVSAVCHRYWNWEFWAVRANSEGE